MIPTTTAFRATLEPRRENDVYNFRIMEYPKQVWFFLACFIAFVSLCQFVSYLHTKYVSRQSSVRGAADAEQQPAPERHGVSLRRLPLAAINMYRVLAFRCTLEIGNSYTLNLAEVFVTAAYIIVIYSWIFLRTTDFAGHPLDPNYWADRAGTIVAIQFPLITALGTKNNLVSLLTGISYEKLNYLHRMMPRVLVPLIWSHAAGRIELVLGADLPMPWLHLGIVAGSSLTILCILSIKPIRAASYETFLYVHLILCLLIVICAFIHTRDRGFDFYIWPCFIIWGLDRVLRGIRLVVFNHSYFGFKSGSTLDATAELLSEQIVRLRLRRPPHFHWRPGQTAYLTLPSVSTMPFEAHPFTIASFESSNRAIEGEIEKQEEAEDVLPIAPYWKELVFIINVREGFTKRLAGVAAQKGALKVFVDGPYGASPDLSPFDTCVLIAGGTGVSYTLPVFLDIIDRVQSGRSQCRRLVFVWAIRDPNHIRTITKALSKALRLAPPVLKISIRIHVTGIGGLSSLRGWDGEAVPYRAENSGGRTSEEGEKDTKDKDVLSIQSFDAVVLTEGRPDLKSAIMEEVDTTNGRVSVSVCGSQSISRTVKHALRFSSPADILRGGPSVFLHVESFGYA